MSKKILTAVLNHPDREDIISKLLMNISPADINAWLESQYTNPQEKQYALPERSLKIFKEEHLDIYTTIQKDLNKIRTGSDEELTLESSSAYRQKLKQVANEELDVRKKIAGLCHVIETRFAMVFDKLEEGNGVDARTDRLLIEYTEAFGNLLEKYYKFTEENNQVNQTVNNNITLQVVDQQIGVFHEVLKELVSTLDLSTSMHFIEMFNDKMSKIKAPNDYKAISSESRLADIQLLGNELLEK